MSQSVPQPRLVDHVDLVARLKQAEKQLAALIIAAHHQYWPKELNGTYTVTQINGFAKVDFKMPASKEPGYRD